MNPFTELKLLLEARKVMKTLLSNGWKHAWTTVSGAVLAVLLGMTNQPDAKHLALAIAVGVLGYIAKDPHKATA